MPRQSRRTDTWFHNRRTTRSMFFRFHLSPDTEILTNRPDHMLARCDLLRLLRERGRQEDAWVSGGHIGEDKQCDTLLSSHQRRPNIREDANTYDSAIWRGTMDVR